MNNTTLFNLKKVLADAVHAANQAYQDASSVVENAEDMGVESEIQDAFDLMYMAFEEFQDAENALIEATQIVPAEDVLVEEAVI